MDEEQLEFVQVPTIFGVNRQMLEQAPPACNIASDELNDTPKSTPSVSYRCLKKIWKFNNYLAHNRKFNKGYAAMLSTTEYRHKESPSLKEKDYA